MKIKLTSRGFKMPSHFSYSADNVMSQIAVTEDEIIIKTAGKTMRATLPVAVDQKS